MIKAQTRTTQRPLLTPAEGNALLILESLLGQDAKRLPRVSARLESPRSVVVSLAMQRLSAAAGRFLLEEGWREGSFLREGRRVEGRLWDAPLNEGFTLRFTEGSLRFWLGTARALAQLTGPEGTGRYRRKLLGDILPAAPPEGAVGDWIFFYLAARSLPLFSLSVEPLDTLLRRLRLASPLLALSELSIEGQDADFAKLLRPLVAPSSVRLLECVGERLGRGWCRMLEELFRSPQSGLALTSTINIWSARLRSYLRLLDEARRLDLVGPLLRVVGFAALGPMSSPGAVWARLSALPGVNSLRQRDDLLRPFGQFLSLGAELEQLRQRMVAEGYGSPRYEESQRYLRLYEEVLGPSAERVETLVREFSGVLG
jgi:hypothetical protein